MSKQRVLKHEILGCILIFFVFFLRCILSCQASTIYSREWGYTLSSGEATLVKYSGDSKVISIPSYIDGYPVTGIGKELFYQSDITSLTIPESIEDIGLKAFADCKYLTQINYNAKNAKAYYARSNMSTHVFVNAGKFSDSLTVTFGASVKSIPTSLFEVSEDKYAHITKIVMSDSIQSIGDWAFRNCFDLKSVVLSSGLLEIGASSFENCQGLTTLTIPSKVEQIGYAAFANCKYLNTLYFNAVNCKIDYLRSQPSTCTFINAGKFSSHLDVIIGNGVKTVPACFFETLNSEYAHVTSVIIPSSVVEIGDFAFNNCYDLKTVTIYSRSCEIPMDSSQFSDAFTNCPKSTIFKLYRNSAAVPFLVKKGFKISYLDSAVNISGCTIKLGRSSYTYNGRTIKPLVNITYGKVKLNSSTDYDVSYSRNKNVGLATVIIKGKGQYEGTVKKYFKILPVGTKISRITGFSKGFKVSINKQKKQTTGYQIQYSRYKNFNNAVSKLVKNSIVSVNFKKLMANRTYYVRARTYKVVGGKRYYSSWSQRKAVKTKK